MPLGLPIGWGNASDGMADVKSWVDYWGQDDFWRDSRLWEISSRLFFERASRIIEFKKTDRVLDIGCGPGYMEAFLAPLVKSVCAVDVASRFVSMCQKRCMNSNNVSVMNLRKDDYTNLEVLAGPFSVILCVSVVQYYRDVGEIEALISSAKKISPPGAKMFIADLPLESGMLGFAWDAVCSYVQGIRRGYAQELLRMALRRWFRITRYKDFYDKTKQLYFTDGMLNSLITRLNLNARIIPGNFSVYANRLNLLIQF